MGDIARSSCVIGTDTTAVPTADSAAVAAGFMHYTPIVACWRIPSCMACYADLLSLQIRLLGLLCLGCNVVELC